MSQFSYTSVYIHIYINIDFKESYPNNIVTYQFCNA